MGNTVNRVIKNTGFLFSKMLITIGLSLYTTRIILNALGIQDYGIYNIVGGAISMLGFLNIAMANATQRFMSFAAGEKDIKKQIRYFNISIVLHFILALILGVILLICGYFFFNGILNIPPERIVASKIIYGSLIISTIITVMTVPYDALINTHEDMGYYAVISILENILKFSIALIIKEAYNIDRLILYGILMAIIPIITMTIMRIYCHKKYKECIFSPRKYFNLREMKKITLFAGWNLVGTTAQMSGNYGSNIIVNHFFGVILNAALGIVSQLTGQLMTFSYNMMKALNPVIVKKEGANERESMLEFSFIGCKYPFFMLAFFAIPFCIETDFFLKIWLKNIPEWTILFFRLQMVRTLIELLTSGLNSSITAVGKIKKWNLSYIITHLFPLISLYVIFIYGGKPYWLFIISIIFMALLSNIIKIILCINTCNLKLDQYIRWVITPCILCSLIPLSISILPTFIIQSNISRVLLTIILFYSTYIPFIYFFGMQEKEKATIKNLYNTIKQKIR